MIENTIKNMSDLIIKLKILLMQKCKVRFIKKYLVNWIRNFKT